MKSVIKIFVVVIWLGSFSANAQEYVFKVLANKGDNSVKLKGNDWAPLKTGQSLNSGDELKLSNEAYLGLMHNSGKTLEVKTSGEYNVNTLADNLKGKNSSVASKYADFVMNRMSDEEGAGDYRKSLGATGAVDRALASGAKIKVMAHSSTDIINPEVIIRWSEPQQTGEIEELSYEVVYSNLFDEVIKTEETDKTATTLNMASSPFNNLENKFVKVKVSVKGKDLNSEEYAIIIKPEDESAEIKKMLNELKSEVQEETALDNMVMAAFYEDNNLLLDALTSYEKAIQIAPEVEIYQKAYEDFIIRNGFAN
ncbi:hypothetical protein JKA74_01040 [Marivirga sp. S37H4]|uniref:Tetratricopeptide repeat protein n=1 Tax=Marivirga aurantiaca TaxID=2802615 RepID=A0A934WVB6_9BACT|nr:hypothetical protein [Marivirga aurantiaca]MBK6263602.1 hypothetical protein [Marivirga aurantiaca]